MGTVADQIEGLALRFPAQAAALRRLYMREPRFRTICDEYTLATRAYKHWNAGDPSRGGKRQSDYHEIMQELEIEIQELLKKEAERKKE